MEIKKILTPNSLSRHSRRFRYNPSVNIVKIISLFPPLNPVLAFILVFYYFRETKILSYLSPICK